MKKIRLLAFECTAHTFGASVIEKSGTGKPNNINTKILSNDYDRYPALKEGFIPRKLADHHSKVFKKVTNLALNNAKIRMEEIDLLAYSYGPGIGHCLHVGYVGAKSLALKTNKPLIPVNHTVAHCEVGRYLFGFKDPLIIYVSGGNTQIAAITKEKNGNFYRVYGETLDVGIGNFFDVLGRKLDGIQPPNAIGVIKQASTYKENNLLDLPYTVKGMDLAFSGLLTACIKEVEKKGDKAQVCFSAQEIALSMLIEACERALCHTQKKEILLVGGVAQNPRLQEMVNLMAKEHRCKVGIVPPLLAGDNAAMIGITAMQIYCSNSIEPSDLPNDNVRLDSTQIRW